MLLTTEHLQALDDLAASEAAGYAAHTPAAAESGSFRVLDLQGLAQPETGQNYCLTYMGRDALHLLREMRTKGLLHPTRELAPGWRFLGSETLAALAAAARAGGRVGPVTEDLLESRGLAEQYTDVERGLSYTRLNAYGKAWHELAQRCRPHLEITADIAAAIHHLPPAYSNLHAVPIAPQDLAQLEAMDLLVWSVPDAEAYVLTALGQAVYEALEKGAYPRDDAVLDEPILHLLATLATSGPASLTAEQRQELQSLGYADLDGAVTAAGNVALHAHQLVEVETEARPASFAISSDDIELMAAVQALSQDASDGSPQAPTRAELHAALVKRLDERYQDFVGEYGRTPEDVKARKQQMRELQTVRREKEHAFGDMADLDELLVQLAARELVRAIGEGAHAVYRLTALGHQVLEREQEAAHGKPRAITAAAVKAITSATIAGRFGAPATAWVNQARSEGLIGPRGITPSGHFYATIAQAARRWPALTRHEAQTLVSLPENEPLFGASDQVAGGNTMEQTLDRLESRGLIDRLVDGQVLRTAAGVTLTRAMRGALELAYPVTPAIVRLLLAIRQVGETLYGKDGKDAKGYLASETWEEVARLTGLEPDLFQQTVHLAKLGQYLGDANLTEAGLDLLTALQEAGWREAR